MNFFTFRNWDVYPLYVGFELTLFWGFFTLECDHTITGRYTKRPWLPCLLTQWGGDHLYYWSFDWFQRSITFSVWKFD